MRNNKLSINYTKTKFMLFSTKKSKKCLNINIGNHELEQVNQLKYLGFELMHAMNMVAIKMAL